MTRSGHYVAENGTIKPRLMIATTDESDKRNGYPPYNDSLRSSPFSSEIGKVLANLHEEVKELRNEVKALRRREAPEGPDALLTREEAAERLGISTRTLGDMADAGELQPVRIRGRVLYDPETLDAYIRRRAGGADK